MVRCPVCLLDVTAKGSHRCPTCDRVVHAFCGTPAGAEGYAQPRWCGKPCHDPKNKKRSHAHTAAGRSDPLADIDAHSDDTFQDAQPAADPIEDPDDDVHPQHELGDAPGGHQPHEQGSAAEGPHIFHIDVAGQAWALDPHHDGIRTMPVGVPDQYTQADVHAALQEHTAEKGTRHTHPHPMMEPCIHCAGLLGEGICRRDDHCTIHLFSLQQQCPDCKEHEETCRAGTCLEATQAVILMARAARKALGVKAYLQACPTTDLLAYDYGGSKEDIHVACTKIWNSPLTPAKAQRIYDTIDWPYHSVIALNDDTQRATVRATGGNFDLSYVSLTEQMLQDARAKLQPKPQARWSADELLTKIWESAELGRTGKFTVLKDIMADHDGPLPTDTEPPRSLLLSAGQAKVAFQTAAIRAEAAKRGLRPKVGGGFEPDAAAKPAANTTTAAPHPEAASPPANQAQDITYAILATLQQTGLLPPATKPPPDPEPAFDEGTTLLGSYADTRNDCIMSMTLSQLGVAPEDLGMRPHLYHMLEAAGYDNVFPFHQMTSSPLAMDMSCMLDENAATPEDKAREMKELQASRKTGGNDFTTDANGAFKLVTGRRPKLTKPQLKKHVKTATDAILAMYNAASYYGAWEDDESQARLSDHIRGMRQLWVDDHLMASHQHFVTLERDIRTMRCRSNHTNWCLNDDPNSPDQRVIARAVMSARNDRVNSLRPGKVQPAAKPGAEGEGTRRKRGGKARGGRGNDDKPSDVPSDGRFPQEFWDLCKDKNPDACVMYAFRGRCSRNPSGESCQMSDGTTLVHTCIHCGFKNGKHAIAEGKCPHATK